jgi:hypothetical protein
MTSQRSVSVKGCWNGFQWEEQTNDCQWEWASRVGKRRKKTSSLRIANGLTGSTAASLFVTNSERSYGCVVLLRPCSLRIASGLMGSTAASLFVTSSELSYGWVVLLRRFLYGLDSNFGFQTDASFS